MTDPQRVLQRAGEAGRHQPDVGTAELPGGPPKILGWSTGPDQSAPISTPLNLAFSSPPGDLGDSVEEHSALSRKTAASLTLQLDTWCDGPFSTHRMEGFSRRLLWGARRDLPLMGEPVCLPPSLILSFLFCRWS